MNFKTSPLRAQEQEGETEENTAALADAIVELEVPDEVSQDSTVAPEDLGVADQNLLPDSPFYPLKEAWREIKHVFTFSAVGDAKLDLQYASEKLIEAQKLSDKGNDEALRDAIDNYEEELADFDEELGNISADEEDNEALEDLQSSVVEVHLKQITILDNLAEEASEETFMSIDDVREQASAGVADLLSKLPTDAEGLGAKIALVVNSAAGSNLRGLKALEVLQAVEEKIPQEARSAVARAQENILHHLERKLGEIPEELRLAKLDGYVKHMPGDETRRLKVLDEMKFKAALPPEVLHHIEVMKGQAVERFNNRLKKFESQEVRDQMFEHLKRGDLSDIRVLEDLKAHALDEEVRQEVEDHQQEGLAKFREVFAPDEQAQDVANRAEELMRQVRENPDPKTFRLLEQLREELTPEQQAFVGRLEEAGEQEMRRRFGQEKEKFFERINSVNPEDFAFMQQFQENFANHVGTDFGAGFEQTIASSANSIQERIKAFDRPGDVEQFQKIFDSHVPPEAREFIDTQIPDLQILFERQKQEATQQFQQKAEFLRQFKERQFEGGPLSPAEFDQRLHEEFHSRFEDRAQFEFPGGGATGPGRSFPGAGATEGQFPRQSLPPEPGFGPGVQPEPALNQPTREQFEQFQPRPDSFLPSELPPFQPPPAEQFEQFRNQYPNQIEEHLPFRSFDPLASLERILGVFLKSE